MRRSAVVAVTLLALAGCSSGADDGGDAEPAATSTLVACPDQPEEAAAGDWPTPLRDSIPVNVTVPAAGPDDAHRITRAGGCRTAKVKVAEPGQTLADDEARLEAVRDALGADGVDPGGEPRAPPRPRGDPRARGAEDCHP